MQHEAKQKLNELLAATSHVLTADDIDDVLELDRLAEQVGNPSTGIDSPLKGHAVYFRSRPVYPLTLAHLEFLDQAATSDECGDQDRDTFILWVLTQPEITDDHYDFRTSRKRARKWSRTCPWRTDDVNAIMELRYTGIIEQGGGTTEECKENADGALVGMLAREYGNDPHYWMHTAPVDVVKACVADWAARQEAQAAAYRRANKGAATAAPAPSPKFVAMRKFRECAERIEAKWLARKA